MAHVVANRHMRRDRVGDFLVGGSPGAAMERASGSGSRGDIPSGNGAGFHGANLGTTLHHANPYSRHIRTGTRFRLGYVLCIDKRTAFTAGRHWCNTDFGRYLASRIETDWAAATSS